MDGIYSTEYWTLVLSDAIIHRMMDLTKIFIVMDYVPRILPT